MVKNDQKWVIFDHFYGGRLIPGPQNGSKKSILDQKWSKLSHFWGIFDLGSEVVRLDAYAFR